MASSYQDGFLLEDDREDNGLVIASGEGHSGASMTSWLTEATSGIGLMGKPLKCQKKCHHSALATESFFCPCSVARSSSHLDLQLLVGTDQIANP